MWLKLAGLAALAVLSFGLAAAALLAPPPASTYVRPPATAGPVETEEPDPTTALFIGDSYTAGAGALTGSNRYTTVVARSQSWIESNVGRGGTGYTSSVSGDAAADACRLEYCPDFREMIPEAVAADPDIVIVGGGRNDADEDVSTEADAITAFYTDLRAALPDAQLIATSPLWDDETAPEELEEISAAVRGAIESVGGVYLDIGQPLQGKAELMSPDGVHPNDEGHKAIGAAIAAQLEASDAF
jgi:lysophospholipase L1-like esterase